MFDEEEGQGAISGTSTNYNIFGRVLKLCFENASNKRGKKSGGTMVCGSVAPVLW